MREMVEGEIKNFYPEVVLSYAREHRIHRSEIEITLKGPAFHHHWFSVL
jgi:hypothetical protein